MYLELSRRIVVVDHLPFPPDIENHAVYLFAKSTSTLFFHHMNDSLLVEDVLRCSVDNPLEEPDLEFFNELLLVWNQFE